MTGFTTVSKTVTRQVTRFTTVAKTVSKKTIRLAHMHFAPSDDSCVFVRADSAPLSDSYGLLHTGCKRFIDHAAAADARKRCVTGRGGNVILHRLINHNPVVQTRGYEHGIPSTSKITNFRLRPHRPPPPPTQC